LSERERRADDEPGPSSRCSVTHTGITPHLRYSLILVPGYGVVRQRPRRFNSDCRLSARHSHSEPVFFHHISNPSQCCLLFKEICADSRLVGAALWIRTTRCCVRLPPSGLAVALTTALFLHDGAHHLLWPLHLLLCPFIFLHEPL
jgi:hypothetical protein